MTIPGLVNTQQIEHIFSSGMQVRISGTLNLETKTLTASVKLTDGSQLSRKLDLQLKESCGKCIKILP
jgi:hypothetical protein